MGRNSLLKGIGIFIITLGVLGLLESIYIEGLRWLNPLVQVLAVVGMGIAMYMLDGWIAKKAGIIVALFALNSIYPTNNIDFNGSISNAIKRGWNEMTGILAPDDKPEKDRKNRNQQ